MKARFINPFTDFGFKKIFGEEASKPLLIDFLNALLPHNSPIVELTFKNSEQLGQTEFDRKAVYDIYCENERGEKFIVELQKARQNFFKDRTVYYSTFPIREQAERGEWDYRLKAVYCVGILDFAFSDYDDPAERGEVVHTVQLKNQHGRVFYDKLTYLYVEMPHFTLREEQLRTRLDQWLYFIKHLEDFQQIPTMFRDAIFDQAFEKAELARLGPAELDRYEDSLKVYRDWNGVLNTAFDDGKAEGLAEGEAKGKAEGKAEVARQLKAMGVSASDIARATGLSIAQIEQL
jgi:predicted transposase/invertase (TIGR01784 family)